MHLPTPNLRSKKDGPHSATQKRKASDSSEQAIKPAPKKLSKKAVRKRDVGDAGDAGELRRSGSTRRDKVDTAHAIPGEGVTTSPERTSPAAAESPENNTLRRSSRIKESVRRCNETWHRCRPYIERLNGTIMPLEHQGTKMGDSKDRVGT